MNLFSTPRFQHAVTKKSSMLSATSKSIKILVMILAVMVTPIIALAQNAIVTENSLTGNPASEWDIVGAGDLLIQGFPTEFSVNKGSTIFFKVRNNGNAYTIKIYRIGYYDGRGARYWGDGNITAPFNELQPTDGYDAVTGKTDCSNWNVSANWNVPVNAVSGVYIAKLTTNGGASHMIFVVRDDNSTSDILCKTSDATWEAYNNYGGNSLYDSIYGGTITKPVPGFDHATKVSYNRPLIVRNQPNNSFFFSEYPMVRWLERNGYNVSYTSCVDMSKPMPTILPSQHKVLISMGHDEYWSETMRTNFENARNAGVHLAFFTANEIYWKTRWEDNYRTLVCYKEGNIGVSACGGKCDPVALEWTGLHRDGCEFSLANGCKPENLLTGQIGYIGAAAQMAVTADIRKLRFWRNTTLASNNSSQTVKISTAQFLGYEIDVEQWDLYQYPAGRIALSNTQVQSTFNGTVSGNRTHKMSLYRHSSGALVFGAGTIQYSWGLDNNHDGANAQVDKDIQQATVNLFADMGVQPGKIQSNLVSSSASTDVTPPVSTIVSPVNNGVVQANKAVTISGTAVDVGGVVGGIEISVDGGATWRSANGTTTWSFIWNPKEVGSYNIKTRSVDDNGNIEPVGSSSNSSNFITVVVQVGVCPCTVFQATDLPIPPSGKIAGPVELGVQFTAAQNGFIKAIRYYKSQVTPGLRTCNLWSSSGTLLGTIKAQSEVIGWNEVSLPTPVAIQANTIYIASVFNEDGYFDENIQFFEEPFVSGPLTAINGAFTFSPTSIFPSQTYETSNYFIDVVYNTQGPLITKNPVSVNTCPGSIVKLETSVASISPSTIKWEKSTNSGLSWSTIGGAATSILNITAKFSDNGTLYRAVWTNSDGVAITASAKLTVYQPIVPVAVVNNGCSVGLGLITVTNTGGLAPFSYSLNGGDFQSGNVFANLSPANYSVVVKDVRGCTANATATISQVVPLVVTLSSTSATNGSNNGTASAIASNGAQPYTYLWSNGKTSATITGLSAGQYTVTVTDSKGCNVTASVTVGAGCVAPIVKITPASVNDFCGDLILSASVSMNGNYTYQWKLGSIVVGTQQTLALTDASLDGKYTVTASSSAGCTSSAVSYSYSKQNTLQSYTILGLDKVDLGSYNKIVKGSVGNTKSGGEVKFDENGSVMSAGAFVKASKISIKSPSNISTKIYSNVSVSLPAFLQNNTSTRGLNNAEINDGAVAVISGNRKDIKIGKNARVTITGNTYGKIEIKEGAKVSFTNADLNFDELNVDDDVNITFTSNYVVAKVSGEVEFNKNVTVNLTGSNVVFYVEGKVSVDEGSVVIASIFAPNDEISVKGPKDFNNRNSNSGTFMTGRFIADKISSSKDGVIWNSFDCTTVNAQRSISQDISQQKSTDTEDKILSDKLTVKVSPNPIVSLFNLNIQSNDANTPVSIRILDINGRVIMAQKAGANGNTKINAVNWMRGIYLAEVIQGGNRKVIKLVKTR